MSTLGYILVFSLGGSLVSMAGGLLLLMREQVAARIGHAAAPFAAGALLATAFLDLLPEASKTGGHGVFGWSLVGMLIFFFLERFVLEFHHQHTHEEEDHDAPAPRAPLVIIGGSLHKFIDGVVIGGTFLVSIPLGIVTTLAVAAHEIPHVIGGFGLLLHAGVARSKVFAYVVFSGVATVVASLLTYAFGTRVIGVLPIFLTITAGFFIYIAASDLIPEIHTHERRSASGRLDILLLLVGIAVVWATVSFLE